MPLDRRITVHTEQMGSRNDHGEYVSGDILDLGVWASKDDLTLEDITDISGVYTSITRRWRIRWDSRIYTSVLAQTKVMDDGLEFDGLSIVEVSDRGANRPRSRRRWLDLTAIHTPGVV